MSNTVNWASSANANPLADIAKARRLGAKFEPTAIPLNKQIKNLVLREFPELASHVSDADKYRIFWLHDKPVRRD